MKTFDGADGVGPQNDSIGHRFHAEHADLLSDQVGQDKSLETAVMCVHHVQGHLHRSELEAVFVGRLEHMKMDVRIFVSCEADKTDLPRLPRLHQRRVGSFLVKNTMGVFVPDNFMVLDQVDTVGLQPL